MCGRPQSLARALAKISGRAELVPMQDASPATAHMFIVSPLTGGGVMSLFSTHPPVEERIRRLTELAQGRR
jgi:heat shock protein HtpX